MDRDDEIEQEEDTYFEEPLMVESVPRTIEREKTKLHLTQVFVRKHAAVIKKYLLMASLNLKLGKGLLSSTSKEVEGPPPSIKLYQ